MIKNFIEWYKFECLFPDFSYKKAIRNSIKYAINEKKWDIINWLYDIGIDIQCKNNKDIF